MLVIATKMGILQDTMGADIKEWVSGETEYNYNYNICMFKSVREISNME
jgi:hypothetical protein